MSPTSAGPFSTPANSDATTARPRPTFASASPTSASARPTSARARPTSARTGPTSATSSPTSATPYPTSASSHPKSARPSPRNFEFHLRDAPHRSPIDASYTPQKKRHVPYVKSYPHRGHRHPRTARRTLSRKHSNLANAASHPPTTTPISHPPAAHRDFFAHAPTNAPGHAWSDLRYQKADVRFPFAAYASGAAESRNGIIWHLSLSPSPRAVRPITQHSYDFWHGPPPACQAPPVGHVVLSSYSWQAPDSTPLARTR